MRAAVSIYLVALSLGVLGCEAARPNRDFSELIWHNGETLRLEGRGWPDMVRPYYRLPESVEGKVSNDVWSWSKCSSGLAVQFRTSSSRIAVRWTLPSDQLGLGMLESTSCSGLDLYVQGTEGWRWLNSAAPVAQSNETILVDEASESERTFLLLLPLYNQLQSLEIGVAEGATFLQDEADADRPLVFYGTSITQGAFATRPGATLPAIMRFRLDRETVNLGFFGSARMEVEMASTLAEVDSGAYVIEPIANMIGLNVKERAYEFLMRLLEKQPDTPIILMEHPDYRMDLFPDAPLPGFKRGNRALRAAFDQVLAEGATNLYYVASEGIVVGDGKGTVDGIHATDLGFERIADALEPVLREVLAEESQTVTKVSD
jgi:hypothetical protein